MLSETAVSRPVPPTGIQVSPERLSEIIGAIYDCVLDPKNWEPTLESINRELSFANSVLGVVALRPGANIVNVSVGLDPEWLSISGDDTYRAEAVALWGGAERMQGFPLDEPIVHSQTLGFVKRSANRYFREILEPRGILDAIALSIAREPSLFGYAAFNRHRSAGEIGEIEVSALRLLGPHFRRAVTIGNLFNMKAIEAKTFASALDAMSAGVILVDENLGIVHANAAAERMLSDADPILSQMGILTLPTKAANDALLSAVGRASLDEAALGQRGIGIPAHSRAGDPCLVHVLPLRRGELRRGLSQRAAAALFVVRTSAGYSRMPADALSLLYDLSPAETRVFELVCEAKTPAEIADEIGVARSTVRSHLLKVFQKTGCSRQVELVKLAASLSLPA